MIKLAIEKSLKWKVAYMVTANTSITKFSLSFSVDTNIKKNVVWLGAKKSIKRNIWDEVLHNVSDNARELENYPHWWALW
jgi:hypothetical protein